MTVRAPPISPADLTNQAVTETSAAARRRVEAARQMQRERYRRLPGVFCNAYVTGRWLERNTRIDSPARAALV